MGLNTESTDSAYNLGRLFAALERAQRLALGSVNATIRDRFMGAASATPATVFPLLVKGAQNHVGKLRKGGKDSWIDREIQDIPPLIDSYPRSLRLEAQGRFFLGYYHQRKAHFTRAPQAGEAEPDQEDTSNDE